MLHCKTGGVEENLGKSRPFLYKTFLMYKSGPNIDTAEADGLYLFYFRRYIDYKILYDICL